MDGGDYNIPFAFLKKHGDNNEAHHSKVDKVYMTQKELGVHPYKGVHALIRMNMIIM